MTTQLDPPTSRWRGAALALAALALATATFSYVQYMGVSRLRAQLADATEEAREATAEETALRSELSTAQEHFNSQAQKLIAAEEQAGKAPPQPVAPARAEAQAVPVSQTPEALPVRLTFHDALFGSGKVAVLQNLSDSDLELVLEIRTAAGEQDVRRRLVVNARGLRRLGPAQGLSLAPGEVVTLQSSRYRPLVQTVS
jgi:hypothetical protein